MSARPKADPLAGFRQMVEASERGNGGALSAWLQTEPDLAELTGAAAAALLTRLAAVAGKAGAAQRLRKDAAAALAERLAAERGLTVHERDTSPQTMTVDGVVLDVPDPYEVGHGVARKTGGLNDTIQRVAVAPRLIAPIAVVRDLDAGGYYVTLAWRRQDGGWTRTTVPRQVAADARAIVSLAGEGAPVTSGQGGEVVRWLSAVEEAGGVPVSDGASSLGWYGSRYLTGTGCIGGDLTLLGDMGTRYHASGWTPTGSLDAWRRKVWAPIEQSYPMIALAVYASVAPILLGILPGARGFVLDICGRQQGGKTVALDVAASVWGSVTHLRHTWAATKVNAERIASLMRHHPTILDDTKGAQKDPEQIAEIVYMVCNGRTKGRGTVTGLAVPRSISTVLISSGEQPVGSFTQDAGARSRCLSLRGLPMGGKDPGALLEAAADNCGWVGPACVRWLHALPEEVRRATVQEWYDVATRAALAHIERGTGARVAGHLALLVTAGRLMQAAIGTPLSLEAVDLAMRAAMETLEDVDVYRSALDYVVAWVQRHAADVDWSDGGRSGGQRDQIARWDESGGNMAINPAALARALAEGGWTIGAVLDEWRRRGWIVTGRTVRMYGRPQKAHIIAASALPDLRV